MKLIEYLYDETMDEDIFGLEFDFNLNFKLENIRTLGFVRIIPKIFPSKTRLPSSLSISFCSFETVLSASEARFSALNVLKPKFIKLLNLSTSCTKQTS